MQILVSNLEVLCMRYIASSCVHLSTRMGSSRLVEIFWKERLALYLWLKLSLFLCIFITDHFVNSPQWSSQRWIKMIFYRVVCTSRKEFRNFSPLISVFFMCLEYHLLFIIIPRVLIDLWIEVVMISLPTLFATPSI